MLKFIIAAAPRSGTAWCANWLSGEKLCLHDPMWDHHYEDLNGLGNVWGIACTGIAYFHDWVNRQSCPKLILHRPRAEIDCALAQIGLPPVSSELIASLWQIHGCHIDWRDLFNEKEAAKIHSFLNMGAFRADRYELLRNFRVTSEFHQRRQNPMVVERLAAELEGQKR